MTPSAGMTACRKCHSNIPFSMSQDPTSSHQAPERKKSRRFRKFLTLLVLVALAAGSLFVYLFYDGTVRSPKEALQKAEASLLTMVEDLVSGSTDRVHAKGVDGRSVEMYSLYEKEFVVDYEYTTNWMFSTKRIRIIQPYRVRYGISTTLGDLQCEWKSYNEIIQVGNLKPMVISCERFGPQSYEEEEGFWNKIHPDERALVQNVIEEKAREEAAADPAALYLTEMRFVEILNREASRQNSTVRYKLAPRG